MVWIYHNKLLVSDTEYLFVYLVAICIYSLMKYQAFCWYFIWAIFVLLLNCRRFFSILAINFILGRQFVNFLCYSGGYLFILLIISSQYRRILVRYSSTCVLLILLLMFFMSNQKNNCQDQCQESFSSFLQGVFQLQVLCLSLIHLELILCGVEERSPISFFCLWIYNFCSIILFNIF